MASESASWFDWTWAHRQRQRHASRGQLPLLDPDNFATFYARWRRQPRRGTMRYVCHGPDHPTLPWNCGGIGDRLRG